MSASDKNEREGLLTTIRARRKWYLGLYFLQIFCWLALVVASELYNTNSTELASQRVLNAAVAMTFIGQGTLITTIFLIDVLFDGCRYLIRKGVETMGLLFDNFENKFVVRGRKQGQKQVYAEWSAWIAGDPEIKKLVEAGKVRIPPGLQVKETPDD